MNIRNHTGTVKWFNQEKGVGFIVPNDGSPDVFVHLLTVLRSGIHTLEQGQRVEYELVDSGPGRAGVAKLKVISR